MSRKILSFTKTCDKTSLSRTNINNKRAKGEFPQAIPLGDKRIGFIEEEVDAWIEARIEAARGKKGAQPRREQSPPA